MDHFLYSIVRLSPTVNTPPLFYMSNPWHHISDIFSVCQVFKLLLLVLLGRFYNDWKSMFLGNVLVSKQLKSETMQVSRVRS